MDIRYNLVYVDLEETIIDNFTTMVFLPNKINKLKKKLNVDLLNVNMFSYAMWCENNKEKIISMHKEFYQYGIVINKIVSTEEMFECCKNKYQLKHHTDVWKLPKKSSFSEYADFHYKNESILLFDDTVDDMVTSTPLNRIEWLRA